MSTLPPGSTLAHANAAPLLDRLRRAAAGERVRLAAGLAVVAALALTARLWALGLTDLVQAEHQKLIAVASWRTGDVFVDGEHPALFKAIVLASTSVLGEGPLGLRLPNALLGAVVALLTALIARRLGGPMAGWVAGGLMALSTLAVSIDRVGKEDTLMLALALGAILCWLASEDRPRLWIAVAALCGAAAAAKYEALPLLPALLVLGWARMGPRPPAGARWWAGIGAAFLGTHLLLNPLIATPEQWRFIGGFVSALLAGESPPDGSLIPTQGFLAAGELFDSKPAWYYPLYLVIKGQLAWVVAIAIGLAYLAARFRRYDRFLLLWALGYVALVSLVPFGFARYLAPALPALAIVGGIGVARILSGRRRAVVVTALTAFTAALAVPLAAALPYPTLYVNSLGGGSDQALHWTPNDAAGNLGMAEAVRIAEARVPEGARVAVVDPTLVDYLSGGRLDTVTVERLPPSPDELRARGIRMIVVQPSELSIGNAPLYEWLEQSAAPATVIAIRGLVTVRIYEVGADGRPAGVAGR
jgi:4-amino-4-deoxy-L-arabinose transferase-like glycosyltransferase